MVFSANLSCKHFFKKGFLFLVPAILVPDRDVDIMTTNARTFMRFTRYRHYSTHSKLPLDWLFSQSSKSGSEYTLRNFLTTNARQLGYWLNKKLVHYCHPLIVFFILEAWLLLIFNIGQHNITNTVVYLIPHRIEKPFVLWEIKTNFALFFYFLATRCWMAFSWRNNLVKILFHHLKQHWDSKHKTSHSILIVKDIMKATPLKSVPL